MNRNIENNIIQKTEDDKRDKTIIQNEEKLLVDDELVLILANDVLDKQYRLYSWADSKTSSLIQTNSILLATIGIIFKDCIEDVLATIMIFSALITNVLSLVFCLIQVKPQGSSGKGEAEEPNLRALSGIKKLNYSWRNYYDKLIRINKKELYEYSARQIVGMASNIDESRKNTTRAMQITLGSIAFMVLTFFSVLMSAKDIHILGRWEKSYDKSNKIRILDRSKNYDTITENNIINNSL